MRTPWVRSGVSGSRRAALGIVSCIVAASATVRPDTGIAAPSPRAVLDHFAGTWDVTAKARAPKPSVVTATFTWVWALDHQFLRGDSGVKSDGSQELQMFGHDASSGGYTLSAFYSSGVAVHLQRGEWDEATRTMTWKNAPTDPIVYTSRCSFEGTDTLRCGTQAKPLGGKLMIDIESVAVRRKP